MEIQVFAKNRMGSHSTQKHLVHCHCFLENGQVFTETQTDDLSLHCNCLGKTNKQAIKLRHSRLQLLLHFGKFLLSHGALPFSKFLKLLTGCIKVWPWWSWRDLNISVTHKGLRWSCSISILYQDSFLGFSGWDSGE